jgi:hypothetical protein
LKEIATVLNDDANFASIMTNLIALKASKTYVDIELAKKAGMTYVDIAASCFNERL